jgi:hypothetical protein
LSKLTGLVKQGILLGYWTLFFKRAQSPTLLILFVLILTLPVNGTADTLPEFNGGDAPPKFVGTFHHDYSDSGSPDTAIIERASSGDEYKISVHVTYDGCSGRFEGFGTQTGNEIVFTNMNDPKCVLSGRLENHNQTLQISEENCTTWHGFKCEFSGQYERLVRASAGEQLESTAPSSLIIPRASSADSYTSFSTEGHPKAQGLGITLKNPSSWVAREGERPHIVKKFVDSENGQICLLTIAKLPAGIPYAISEFQHSDLIDALPEGAEFLFGALTKLDSLPAMQIGYKMTQEQAGTPITTYGVMYATAYDRKIIQMICGVFALSDTPSLRHRFSKYQPLYQIVANSLVVQNQWSSSTITARAHGDAATKTAKGSGTYDFGSGDFWLTFVFSVLITWSTGLAPAFIFRYLVYRRPLSRKAANWISGVSCFTLAMIFLVIKVAAGDVSGISPVWIIVFLVSRWIMTESSHDRIKSGRP